MKTAAFVITVRDLDRTTDFYCTKLGMVQEWKSTESAGVRCGSSLIEFRAGGRDYNPSRQEIGYSHSCYSVGDVEALARRLHDLGLVKEPTTVLEKHDLCQRVHFQDPDGYPVSATQYLKDSPLMKTNHGDYDFETSGWIGLGHLAFVTGDHDKTISFYKDLGFEISLFIPDNQKTFIRIADGEYLEMLRGGVKTQENPNYQYLSVSGTGRNDTLTDPDGNVIRLS